jgi:hypothetical protein
MGSKIWFHRRRSHVIFITMWIPFFWLLSSYNHCFVHSCCRLLMYLSCFTNTMKVLNLQRLIITLYPFIRLVLSVSEVEKEFLKEKIHHDLNTKRNFVLK